MTSARDRAAALRKRDAPPPPAEEEKPTTPPRAPRTRPVRQTVDLAPHRHHELAAWRMETALALGKSRLTTQDVLSAAVDVLLDDPTVARRVRARLEEMWDD